MNENIILINPAVNPASQNKVVNEVITNLLPTSLGALAGFLRHSGVDSFKIIDEQIDFLDDDKLRRVISGLNKPRIVGISVLTINSSRAYRIADEIKRIDPGVFVVLGGIHPTVLPEEALSHKSVDVVVRGEGEHTFLELIRLILNEKDHRNIAGISFVSCGKAVHNPDRPIITDLDTIPPFPYDLFEKDITRYGCFSAVFTSRGCPHNCTFCSSRNVSGTRYRHHTTGRIISDIEFLVNRYGQRTIWLIDDNIAANRKSFIELLDAIMEKGLHEKVEFHGSMRGDNVTEEILDKARAANFRMLSFGLETMSESLMKVIKKGETVETVVSAIRKADAKGIAVAATLIFGLPTETREDRWRAMKLVRDLPLSSVRFNTLTPYPGTPVFDELSDKGDILIKKDWENFAVQYMWEGDDIPYVPDGNDRYELLFDTMFANLSFYLSVSGIKRMLKSSFAGGNVINLKKRWYLSPKTMRKLINLFFYLTRRFLYITARVILRKICGKKEPGKSDVVVTDDASFLRKNIGACAGNFSYIVIDEDKRCDSVREFISGFAAAREVVIPDIIDQDEFTKRYSSFVGEMNKNNGSLGWWAMNFTNKNPILTMLCKNIFDFFAVKNAVKISSGKTVVVVTSRHALARFIKKWAKLNNMNVSMKVGSRPDPRLLSLHVPTLFAFYNFFRYLGRMISARSAFGPDVSGAFDDVIITQFVESSFADKSKFRDLYFGDLAEFLRKEGDSVITCGFSACAFRNVLGHGRASRKTGVYPLEYFLTAGSLFQCLAGYIAAAHSASTVKGGAFLDGEDMEYFVKSEVGAAFSTAQVFGNMAAYYAARDLFRKIGAGKVLYPFENRSWEKMVLMAAGDSGKKIKSAGYQHCSLSRKHINYMLEKDEALHTPFPDEVISMGKITDDLMKNFFGFPPAIVKRGCALRQAAPRNVSPGGKSGSRVTLFFPLASNIDEYVRTLRFIDKASLDKRFTLKIRPHFAVGLERALNIYQPKNFTYVIDKEKDLSVSMADSDIVLYAAATVGIEALAAGKPVVHIDFGNFINSDPLFSFSDFKWVCRDPAVLSHVIDEICLLDGEDLEKRRLSGICHARDYFYPANPGNMKVFCR